MCRHGAGGLVHLVLGVLTSVVSGWLLLLLLLLLWSIWLVGVVGRFTEQVVVLVLELDVLILRRPWWRRLVVHGVVGPAGWRVCCDLHLVGRVRVGVQVGRETSTPGPVFLVVPLLFAIVEDEEGDACQEEQANPDCYSDDSAYG